MEKESKTLTFLSTQHTMAEIERLVNSLCERFHIAEDYYGNMLVAVSEAVNNAIQHGNRNNPAKKVIVGYHISDEVLSFSVKDEGAGFDYAHIPDPTAPENLEKPNGRGVFLMRNLAERVSFEDNGSKALLEFKTK